MAQGFSSRAAAEAKSLADSLEKFLQSAEEKKTEVNSKIDLLIQIANTRRQALLIEIDKKIELTKEDVRRKQVNLSQLEKTEIDIVNNLTGNKAIHALNAEICKQINNIDLNLPKLKIKWSNGLTRIIEMFDIFSQLLIFAESPFELENNAAPIWTAGLNCGSGTNEITEAKSVAIDPETQNIYVGDAYGTKILIFNKVGDFERTMAITKSSIGRMIIHRSSIYCHINSNIYSTKLSKLNKESGKLISELETGYVIRGLAVWSNMVYTCSKNSKQILRFSTDLLKIPSLTIQSPYIKRNVLWHSEIQDMICVEGELIMLLSYAEYPIQVFDKSGHLSRCVNLENYSVLGEQFLCVDMHWNIIISCHQNKSLSVYNKQGKRIATVGKVGQEREDMYYPRGIVLDANGSLVVCDCKKKFILQAY